MNEKEFYGSTTFCFREITASIEELIAFLLPSNYIKINFTHDKCGFYFETVRIKLNIFQQTFVSGDVAALAF